MVFSDRKTIFFEHLNKLLSSCTIRPLCPGLFAKHYNKSFCAVYPLLSPPLGGGGGGGLFISSPFEVRAYLRGKAYLI